MKIKIIKLEEKAGQSFAGKNWQEPMYIVNDRYICSSIAKHNWVNSTNGWLCDFRIGEEADVAIHTDNQDSRLEWIARIT